MRGSDFKDIGSNTFEATYTITDIGLFEGKTGDTITLIPNLLWDGDDVNVNNSQAIKITAPSSTATNGNNNANATGIPNNATDTGVSATLGSLDQEIGSFFNPLQKNTLPELLATLLRILFAIIGTLAVIIIIVAGFKMVLANGNEAELTKAKAAITWAIVGLIVSLMAFSIVAIVQKLIQG